MVGDDPRLRPSWLYRGCKCPTREWFSAAQPIARNTVLSGCTGHNATDHRTVGINIAKPAGGQPDGLWVGVKPMCRTPEHIRNSILRGHSRAIAQATHDLPDLALRRKSAGSDQ